MKEKIKNWIDNNHITLHVYAGMLVTVISGFILHIWFSGVESGCFAVLMGILAGAFKEIVIDKWLGLGHPHWQDFFYTCWGVLWGIMMFIIILNIHNGVNEGIFTKRS